MDNKFPKEKRNQKFKYRRFYNSHFEKLQRASLAAKGLYIILLSQHDESPIMLQSTMADQMGYLNKVDPSDVVKWQKREQNRTRQIRTILYELRDLKIIFNWKNRGKKRANEYRFVINPFTDVIEGRKGPMKIPVASPKPELKHRAEIKPKAGVMATHLKREVIYDSEPEKFETNETKKKPRTILEWIDGR